jgi:hypothetical protein
MSFTESNTVEQMILDAATSLGSGAGSSFRPRMTRTFTDGIQSMSFLSVPIREIRGSNFLQP